MASPYSTSITRDSTVSTGVSLSLLSSSFLFSSESSSSSFISDIMPEQFLMRYDYEFMYALRQTLIMFREKAPFGIEITAHRVIDELVLYLIMEESEFLMEDMDLDSETEDEDDDSSDWRSWAFDVFDDMDIVTYLYSEEEKLDPEDTYHFDNWFKEQFYVDGR